MSSTNPINHITFDAVDPWTIAGFWSALTGFAVDEDNEPGDEEVAVVAPDPLPLLLFVRVPEGKVVKNRVHLDISPTQRTRDEEVARLVGLGARVLHDRRRPDGTGWVVMADPEGNEFCVERSQAERQQAGADG